MPFDSAPVETDSVVLALMRAKQRIEDPANWCQDHPAHNSVGSYVEPHSPRAVAWCALGAIWADSFDTEDRLCRALNKAALALFPTFEFKPAECEAAQINDNFGHSAVMQVYDRAIALRRAETGGV